MQKLFFILMALISFNTAFAQKLIPSAYAFSIIIQPGTLPIDENGIPLEVKINKERFIYVMLPGKNKPTIKSIQYNKTAVKWNILNEAEKEYSAISESTQKTMKIKSFKGGTMWRIYIQEYPNHSISPKALPIIIKGIYSSKPFTIMINKETAVQGYDSY